MKYLPDGDEVVDHDVEEHKELEQTMKKLEAADAQSPEFTQLLTQLETILRDHVSDEENEQFPELRAQVPREELIEIGGKVENAKKLRRLGPIQWRPTMRSSTSSSARCRSCRPFTRQIDCPRLLSAWFIEFVVRRQSD
ncbi:MAG TPA: hemerythrin domain-containing protein [Propionibacteriaceae bacterium]